MSTFDKNVFNSVAFSTFANESIGSSAFDSNVFDEITFAALAEGGLFTFIPSTRLITISSSNPLVNVEDLYLAWQSWVAISNNSATPPAFRVEGGDPLNPFVPKYYYLINDWRIVVDGFNATFGYNLLTATGDNPIVTINGGTALLVSQSIGANGGGLTEEIFHTWLDSYPNVNGNLRIDYQSMADTVWNEVI
jgi:hypothetical protein